MKTHDLIQGTPEWLAHRSTHFNASDAPAMMGCSSYKTRTELLHELKTGIVPTVDAATQFRFDEGHRIEALARPLAEEIIGEDLYPVTGSEGELSASFDGLTMDEDMAFEHKTLNEELRKAFAEIDTMAPEYRETVSAGDCLPKQYRVQMEQQLIVSGAVSVLFMASTWSGNTLLEKRHCWYRSDKELRAEIIAGWKQFATDLATFVPVEVLPAAVATPVVNLPTVFIQVGGDLTIESNFAIFEVQARAYIKSLPANPSTDQEFADVELGVKNLETAAKAIKATVAAAIGKTASLDQVCRTGDMLIELMDTTRLALDKLVTARKSAIRLEITQAASQQFAEHMAGLNQRLGRPYMPQVPTDFPGVIKGKRTVESLQNAVNTELARAKIASSAIADKIDANLKTLRELTTDHAFLFNDTSTIVLKANDDFTALVKLRISEHKAAEEKKEAESRERIRQEELNRIAAETKAAADAAAVKAATPVLPPALTDIMPLPVAATMGAVSANPAPFVRRSVPAQPVKQDSVPTLALGTISDRLGFNVTSAFLATLGFEATTVKAAKLFHESDFPLICRALIEHIESVCETA